MSPQSLTYHHAGQAFGGFWRAPRRPARGGVLVLHGGGGLSPHERRWCGRLAAAGYAAYAPDLFGEAFRDRQHAVAVIGALANDPDRLRGRLQAALGSLRMQPSVQGRAIAALGFCFGGMAALELARSGADIAAAASVHGGLSTQRPATPGSVRAEILVCAGAEDPFVTAEHRQALEAELRAAQARWTLLLFGGALHGFTHREPSQAPGNAYDELAEAASWRAVRDLFARRLQAP